MKTDWLDKLTLLVQVAIMCVGAYFAYRLFFYVILRGGYP